MSESQGKCPGCDQKGPVGEACSQQVCGKHEYHHIPPRYWLRAEMNAELGSDPWIGRMIGDFLIVGFIGSGGFGKVYLGLQQPLFRLRGAVKILDTSQGTAEFAEAMLEKFEGEAAALADLSHPNIVRLLKYGTHRDHPYLVMEYVDRGRTLLDEAYARAETGEPLPYDDLLSIMRKLLNGLDAAHSFQIIHRDIKPENIMIQRIAGDPLHVRILDFGMAKFVEKRAESRWALGSPTYMAPEQISGQNIGPWTDLFAVGVICFELFTGQRPFSGETDQEIVAKKTDEDYDPVERLDEKYPPSFCTFMRRALASRPEERFRSTDTFWDGLCDAMEGLAEIDRAGEMPSVELTSLLESRDIFELSSMPAAHVDKPKGPKEPKRKAPPVPFAAIDDVSGDDFIVYESKLTLWDRVEIAWEKLVAKIIELELGEKMKVLASRGAQLTKVAGVRTAKGLRELGGRTRRFSKQAAAVDYSQRATELWRVCRRRALFLMGWLAVTRLARAIDAFAERVDESEELERFEAFLRASKSEAAVKVGKLGARVGQSPVVQNRVVQSPVVQNSVKKSRSLLAAVNWPLGRYPTGFAIIGLLMAVTIGSVLLSKDATSSAEAGDTRAQDAPEETDSSEPREAALGESEGEDMRPAQPSDAAELAFAYPFGPATKVTAVSAGRVHTCSLLDNGAVRCWGGNRDGELGLGHSEPLGDDEPASFADFVPLEEEARAIAVAGDLEGSLSCAVLDGGELRCWGNDGSTREEGKPRHTAPRAVDLGGKVSDVDLGGSGAEGHGCALLDSGAVRCWGTNRFGQLGYAHTNTLGVDTPPTADVLLADRVQQIAVGQRHSCALLESGKIQCWGWNRAGQLGYGHTDNLGDDEAPYTVGDVPIGSKVVQITAGGRHTCALTEGGKVRCWGWNEHGQLGYGHTRNIGDDETTDSAGSVDIGGPVEQISAGGDHTCALLRNGSVRCWGANEEGQLGHPDSLRGRPTPAQLGDVKLGAKAVAVSAGFRHSCAITENGALVCWGRNAEGQLGYGHTRSIGVAAPPSEAGELPVLAAE